MVVTDEISDFFYSSQQLETRIPEGFTDLEPVAFCRRIPALVTMISETAAKGFRYSGDIQSGSKACTDPEKKRIYIARDKSVEEACLSLAYELTNAVNSEKLQAVFAKYLSDKIPTEDRATEYAHEILRVEAEAVFLRSTVAIECGLTHLIKNQSYVELARENSWDQESATNLIFEEMINNGTVPPNDDAETPSFREGRKRRSFFSCLDIKFFPKCFL